MCLIVTALQNSSEVKLRHLKQKTFLEAFKFISFMYYFPFWRLSYTFEISRSWVLVREMFDAHLSPEVVEMFQC